MKANSGSPGSSSPNTSAVTPSAKRVREQHRADEVERRHDRAHERDDDEQDDDDGQRRHERRVGRLRLARVERLGGHAAEQGLAAARRAARDVAQARDLGGRGVGERVGLQLDGHEHQRESREWLTIVVDATAGSASSAAITSGALVRRHHEVDGRRAPGPELVLDERERARPTRARRGTPR